MKKSVRKFKAFAALALVLVMAMSTSFNCFAGGFFGSSEETLISEATAANSKVVANQIQAEGTVLIKNEDNILPLKSKKVNVFGAASCSLAFSGAAGSGAVRSDDAVGFYDALTKAGIDYNKDIHKVYSDYTASDNEGGFIDFASTVIEQFFSGGKAEMPISNISDQLMTDAVKYSKTAVVVIGRVGTEMKDFEVEGLKLTDAERAMLDKVCATFSDVIVVFNISNVMDMSWLDEYDSIKAALIMWLPGEVATESVGKILSGAVNPSGKLVDTIAYNLEDHPSVMNFGNYMYKGVSGIPKYFVNYNEGIYVGYRYFETFAPEQVMYPFGYGLSYTSFDWNVKSFSADKDNITVKVQVKNTGKVAGKDVVQVYFSAPYYDGGIEKSSIELAAYAKTKLLAPGQSEVLTISYKTEDMASYDEKVNEAWVLEKGSYKIHIAHDIRDFEKTYNYNVVKSVVYKTDSATGHKIENLFDFTRGSLTYMSRADVEGTYPTAPTDYQATDEVINSDIRPEPVKQGEAPATGVTYDDGVITLKDVAENEKLWDKFLDQLTVDELIELICDCGYETTALDRLGIPNTSDNDGPSCIKGSGGLLYTDCGLAFPVSTVLACTWNDDLAEEFGKAIGREGVDLGTHVWYAPGCNLHRSPLGGRNYEYYSEDPLLSGKMSAAVTRGAQSKGIVVTVKHFVANDQETNRQSNGLYTWLNEQSMRELYAEPFEISVKEGKAKGIMTAYNRIGNEWCGGSKALITDLLRDEWGFDGFVITDASIDLTGDGYLDPALAVYAGNDAILTMLYVVSAIQTRDALKKTYEADPIGMGNAMRQCVYNICRMKISSNAFDPDAEVNPDDEPQTTEKPAETTTTAPATTATKPATTAATTTSATTTSATTTTAKGNNPANTQKNPNTGDPFNPMPVMLVLACAVFVAVIAKKKKLYA